MMELFRSNRTADTDGEVTGRLRSRTSGPPSVQEARQVPGDRRSTESFVPSEFPTDPDLVVAVLRRGVPVRVLIIGDGSAVAPVLARIQEHCGQPLYDCRPGRGLALPDGCGTVVLRDVSALHVREQQQVSAWMTECGTDCSVLATSAEPLFPVVMRGAFSADLFYRLNVVTIECARLAAG
jgi:hypothetical protein